MHPGRPRPAGLRMSKVEVHIFIPGKPGNICFFPVQNFRISAGFGLSEFRKRDVSICNMFAGTVGKVSKEKCPIWAWHGSNVHGSNAEMQTTQQWSQWKFSMNSRANVGSMSGFVFHGLISEG